MAALFDVGLRTAEAEDQKIAQSMPRGFQIVCRVHRPQYVVGGNLSVKRVHEAVEPGVADSCIDVLLFH
jgi:hypothetical protein